MNYKIWNKLDDINGCTCDYVIKELKIKDSDEVFLILDAYDKVTQIQISNTIKNKYGLDVNLNCEQVAQEYIKIIQEEQNNQQQEILSLEDAHNKIDILEAEKEALKKVTKEQDDLLVENAFKIAEIQMKLGGM